jgi:5-hydroxytryptamine receptor 7
MEPEDESDFQPFAGDSPSTPTELLLNASNANATTSATLDSSPESYQPWEVALVVIACGIIVCGTIVGNVLVCTAVAIVRRLRTPSNLLIVSLAVSDLLVAILVMPFATMYDIMGRWDLGQTVCDAWTSLDVFLCTASILNLCAISVDRYFVITRPFQYAMKRTPMRMVMMIVFVWILSALISIPPLFSGGKTNNVAGQCAVSQAIWYQFYATIGAFYLPLSVMIVIYTRIYLVSSRIASAEARSKPVVALSTGNSGHCAIGGGGNHIPTSGSTTPLRKESAAASDRISVQTLNNCVTRNGHGGRTGTYSSGGELLQSSSSASASAGSEHRFRLFGKSRLNRISASNERKATKTLGVIMGAFTACWLPFFILALIKPFCSEPETCIPHWLNSLLLWLGYANSFLNPIIYARFNRDFRTPFMHILQCHIRDINTRLRSENYAEQFGRGGGTGGVAIGTPVAAPPGIHVTSAGGASALPDTTSTAVGRQSGTNCHDACSAIRTRFETAPSNDGHVTQYESPSVGRMIDAD